MSKSTLDKSLLDVISDPDGMRRTHTVHTCTLRFGDPYFTYERFVFPGGTAEDKMRLFLIYYITAQQPPSEVTQREKTPTD